MVNLTWDQFEVVFFNINSEANKHMFYHNLRMIWYDKFGYEIFGLLRYALEFLSLEVPFTLGDICYSFCFAATQEW